MTPVLKLTDLPLLADAGLTRIVAALGVADAMMVGGCVRAAILGEDTGDIDIATVHKPDAVAQKLNDAGIKVVPTGLAHGTVTAVVGGRGYEITTLRRDVETDGRRAVVAFTRDWNEDAQRRDFTMNTLLMSVDGSVYDPTGRGVADLKAGIVRFVGDAETRIAEDALRILRFFRFFARYGAGHGRGALDADGYDACRKRARDIENLSRERITAELDKLWPMPGAGDAIDAMIQAGVMSDFFQTGFNKSVYQGLCNFVVKQASEVVFPTFFYYSVCENKADFGDMAVLKYIVFSNAKRTQLKQCIDFMRHHSDSTLKNLYLYGPHITLAGSLLLSISNGKAADTKAFKAVLETVRAVAVPMFPVKAGDVMRVTHLEPGIRLGEILKKVEAWWLDSDTKADASACLDYAKTLVPGR